MGLEKIFPDHISSKGLVSRISYIEVHETMLHDTRLQGNTLKLHWDTAIHILKMFFFSIFNYFSRIKKDRVWAERGRERGRYRIQSRLQVPSCQHTAKHGAWTHKLWDQDLSWSQLLNLLSQPGAHEIYIFLKDNT